MHTNQAETVRAAWRANHLAPLWESPNAHKPPPPPQQAHAWHWETLRPLVEMAFAERSPASVERRVLQLMSPHSRSDADEFTVGTILAAIQSLLPGETARPHRHSMSALRFVLEGGGADTIVDGKVCPMQFGDLILTPNWCWHEHRHGGEAPVLWLDVLDVPLHAWLGTVQFQPGPVASMPSTAPDAAFAVPNILPEGFAGRRDHSPVFRYPYADVVAALAAAPLAADGARRVRYVNPLTGGPAMEMLDLGMLQLDAGAQTTPVRSSANALYLVLEGQGETRIGERSIRWGQRDIFTAPQWNWVEHRSLEGAARLFVISDREVMRKLGVYQEESKATSKE